MTLKSGAKFKKKNWIKTGIFKNFHPTTQTFKHFTSMGHFWPKYMKFNGLKHHRGVIFHDTEQWCKIWLKADPVVTKMGWGIGWTSPTPISLRPGFLFSGINQHERKASVVWVSIRSVDSFWKKCLEILSEDCY